MGGQEHYGNTRVSRLQLSVVIPTLNAAQSLAATIATVHAAAAEVVVADGGSSDATVAIARRLGARVVVVAPGRGVQLAAGCAAAGHDWLLLLHADTRLNEAWGAEDRRKLLAFARDLLNSDYAGHRLTFALFAQSPPFAHLNAVYVNFDFKGPLGFTRRAAGLSERVLQGG